MGATWAEFAVCRHPANQSVTTLDEPVNLLHNAIEAFRSLSSNNAVWDWDAERVIGAISSTGEKLADWEKWMRGRYFD